jgi:hypothetical protein
MTKHKRKQSEAEALATSAGDGGLVAPPGFVGPGYSGFGGSAGYNGAGVGGIAGGYAGGSSDYSWTPPPETRHDDRIHDAIVDRLSLSDEVDASDVQVEVEAGDVTLTGNVENRHMKQIAGDIAEAVPGVSSVHNRLHVEHGLLDELKDKLAPPRHSRAR